MRAKSVARYSIARARSELPKLIHEVERGRPIEITRRGQPVAVVVSVAEYDRARGAPASFMRLYEAWRRTVEIEAVGVEPDYFGSLRDRSEGRKVRL